MIKYTYFYSKEWNLTTIKITLGSCFGCLHVLDSVLSTVGCFYHKTGVNFKHLSSYILPHTLSQLKTEVLQTKIFLIKITNIKKLKGILYFRIFYTL